MKVLIVVSLLVSFTSAQQIKEVVKGHLDEALRVTKEQLGLGVEVIGKAGYSTSDSGTNLTFVLSGSELGSNVDPFVKLSYRSKDDAELREFGNTESGIGASQATWTQVFWFIWKKGYEQKWYFRVLDHNSENRLLGEGVLDVDLFAGSGPETTLNLDTGTGKLVVTKTTPLKFKLSASNLQRSDEFNGKSDPYVKVYFRTGEHGKDKKFYTTSTIDNVEHAKWDDVVEFGNYQKGAGQYLHFKVRDADSITKDDHLGEVLVPADSISMETKEEQTVYLENSGEHSSLTIVPI